MTNAHAVFHHWRNTQVFYRQEILDAATYYQDGNNRVVIWHQDLGVLKTIPRPCESLAKSHQHETAAHE